MASKFPYYDLCQGAGCNPDLLVPKPNITRLRRAAELAVAIHEKSFTATKHHALFQAAAENVTRCIAIYYANWRRSPVQFGNELLVSESMLSTIRDIWKFVDRYQPSAPKSRLPSLRSSATDIRKLNDRMSSLHSEQPEELKKLPEVQDLQKLMADAVLQGVRAMNIDDPAPHTTHPVNISRDSQNPSPTDQQIPSAGVSLPTSQGQQWTQPRSRAESVSDEDEPADYAAAPESRSIHADAEVPAVSPVLYSQSESERQRPETGKRSSTKKPSKRPHKEDYSNEEGGNVDEGRRKRSTKKPKRYSSDLDEDYEEEPRTSEDAPTSSFRHQNPLAQLLSDASKKGSGPININNAANVIGNVYNTYQYKPSKHAR